MKSYYEHGGITIYHADARDVLPPGDIVLTDPPWGVGLSDERPPGMRRHGGGYTINDDSEEYVIDVVVPIIASCIARCLRTVVTPGTRCLFAYPRPVTIWSLYCPNGSGLGRWHSFNCWQPVLCYGAGPNRVGSLSDTIVNTEAASANGHPCPKPLSVWQRLLDRITDAQEQVILDPFMGSGTTLVAAKNLGYRAIGVEIEERYCEIAVRRLAQERLDL